MGIDYKKIIGIKVIHKTLFSSYGEGVVTACDGKYFEVKFSSKTAKFEYPDAFKKSIRAKDETIQKMILGDTIPHPSAGKSDTTQHEVSREMKPSAEKAVVTTQHEVSREVKVTPEKRSDTTQHDVSSRAKAAPIANREPERSSSTNAKLAELFDELRRMEKDFLDKYDVDDIYSNSKIYEIIIANHFGHTLIPGHSGSRDAKDASGREIEYKHYKESSKNHTWTFNDFSDETINKLRYCPYVYFVYVDDVHYGFPGQIKWAYITSGVEIADYLAEATKKITNKRKMINVSPRQLESIGCKRTDYDFFDLKKGTYGDDLVSIISTIQEIEKITGVIGLLTSNKIWELMIGIKLNHTVNSEQGGREGAHDASDDDGHLFEYKVSKSYSWNFQDISDNVLNKYYNDYRIILAVVDKTALRIEAIYSAKPEDTVPLLRKKLTEKNEKYELKDKEVRRLQVSLSKSDLKTIKAEKLV